MFIRDSDKGPAEVLPHREAAFVGIDVVKEDTADSTAFTAMGEVKVLVAFFLVARVKLSAMELTGIFPGLVKVDGILIVEVVGGHVGTAAEPLPVALFDVAKIGMHGGGPRVARMQNQRDPGSEKVVPFAGIIAGIVLLEQAVNLRKINPCLLMIRPFGEDAAGSATAAGTLPAVLPEAPAIQGFKSFADAILKLAGEIAAALSQGLDLRGCT